MSACPDYSCYNVLSTYRLMCIVTRPLRSKFAACLAYVVVIMQFLHRRVTNAIHHTHCLKRAVELIKCLSDA